jgi:hypothetical protein
MIKTRKKVLALITLIVLVLAIAVLMQGCARVKQASAAGKYVQENNANNYLELKADGSVFCQQGSMGLIGKYEIEGDQMTIKWDTGMADRATIAGNTVTESDGAKWTKR